VVTEWTRSTSLRYCSHVARGRRVPMYASGTRLEDRGGVLPLRGLRLIVPGGKRGVEEGVVLLPGRGEAIDV
jgi:hypothetical protein